MLGKNLTRIRIQDTRQCLDAWGYFEECPLVNHSVWSNRSLDIQAMGMWRMPGTDVIQTSDVTTNKPSVQGHHYAPPTYYIFVLAWQAQLESAQNAL